MTDPFVPADRDVRDLNGFMLNVERLLASELVAIGTPEECWAALMLWCRAWKQVPGGSLPNDDRILASFSGAGKRWNKVKDVALHGFELCSDGRLYHRFLCAEVERAYAKSIEFKKRKTRDAERLREWRSSRTPEDGGWEGLRQAVFQRDGFKCCQCGSTEDLHAHHIHPRRYGGTDDMQNLQTLCRGCHGKETATERHRYARETVSRAYDMHFVAEETGTGTGTGRKKEEGRAHTRASATSFAFEGDIIRLTRADLDKWRESFSAIEDLTAELRTIDAKFVDEGVDRRKWFGKAAAWLRTRHEKILKDRRSTNGSGFGAPGFA